jgi:hypothetical protein
LKTNQILAETTKLNSIEQEGIRKELSEENEKSNERIEGKPTEERKDFNQENKTK